MSARTGELSLDGAWGIDANVPVNPSVAMLNGYNGAALPSKARADTVGRPLLLGFESAVDRAFAGADAGWRDGNFSCDVFDAWGYPLECGSWVCAHDGNGTPGWALANIEAYGERYGAALVARGRTGPVTVYGENAAVDALFRGLNRAGLVGLRWLVGTWGNGEGGGPNQPPPFAECEQLQSGNTSGPYPATDLDWLYADVSTFAPYGLALPPTPVHQEDSMLIGLKRRSDGTFDAALVDGGVVTHSFGGPMKPWGFLTGPEDAQQFSVNTGTHPFEFNDAEWTWIDQRTKATLGAPVVGGGDGEPGPAPVDLAPVRAAWATLGQALDSAGA